MTVEEKIVFNLAQEVTEKISNKIILQLQRIKVKISGDDSLLNNCWDEICVQIQGQESVFFESYKDEIHHLILEQIKELDDYKMCAIYSMTDNGIDYYDVQNEADVQDYNPMFVLLYIKDNLLYSKAANWSNPRIRQYLGSETTFE